MKLDASSTESEKVGASHKRLKLHKETTQKVIFVDNHQRMGNGTVTAIINAKDIGKISVKP